MVFPRLSLFAFVLLTIASNARGQNLAANSVVTETEEDQLAREVDDPTAILTQLKLQDQYTPESFKTPAQTNEVNLKVVLPVEPLPFLPSKQIVRLKIRE